MNWLREIALNNLALKGLALLLAGFVWHQVTSREITLRTVTLPITFVNTPANTEVLSKESDRRVDVALQSDRGSGGINEQELAVVVDLKPFRIGDEHLVPLNFSDVRRPSGVDVVGITPPRIRLKLEATRSQQVPIEPQLVGEPGEGYEVTATVVSPGQITIQGPESHVLAMRSAPTGTITVSGQVSTFKQTTFIDLEDPRLRFQNPGEVVVQINIEEKRKNVSLKGIAVQVVPEGARARLNPGRIDIQGTVPLSFSDNLDARSFQVVVDVSSLEVGGSPSKIAPAIVVPPQYATLFRLSRLVPVEISVRRTR